MKQLFFGYLFALFLWGDALNPNKKPRIQHYTTQTTTMDTPNKQTMQNSITELNAM